MSIRNKVKVTFFLEDGCEQDAGETSISWVPINFEIYSDMFPELINDAIDEWIGSNSIDENTRYEVIFAHEVERDSGGANVGEYFEQIYQEAQSV